MHDAVKCRFPSYLDEGSESPTGVVLSQVLRYDVEHKQSARVPTQIIASPSKSITQTFSHLLLSQLFSPRSARNKALPHLHPPQVSSKRISLIMSDAPRVELNPNVFPDLDPSAPSNQTAGTSTTHTQPANGSANGNLAQSAQKAGNSILESKVSGTERLRALPRPNLTPYITVLICNSHTINFPPNTREAAQNAMSAAANHPSVQSAKDTVVNGEVCRRHPFPPQASL